jgi:hypothetical protein
LLPAPRPPSGRNGRTVMDNSSFVTHEIAALDRPRTGVPPRPQLSVVIMRVGANSGRRGLAGCGKTRVSRVASAARRRLPGVATTLWVARVCGRELRSDSSTMNPHRLPRRASLATADPCCAARGSFSAAC